MKKLDGLIHTLGTIGFPHDLYAALVDLARVAHVSLLRFDGDRCARLVLAVSRPGWRFAQEAQQAYLEHFCALDPNRRAFVVDRPQERPAAAGVARRVVMRRLRCDEVPDRDYRRHCYERAGLVDRLSVLCVDAQGGYALNLYRNDDDGPFGEGELACVQDSAAVLAACCVKHDILLPPAGAASTEMPGVEALEQRLQGLQPRLSRRECAVAARVLTGMTSDGIAVDLGIGLQSVLTYRKRAYAKLGVCSQRELLWLLLGASRRSTVERAGRADQAAHRLSLSHGISGARRDP